MKREYDFFFIFPFFKEQNRQISKSNFGQMFLATFYSDFRGENFLYQLFTQLPKKNNLSQIPCLSLKNSPKTEIKKKKLPTIYERVLQILYIHIF